jgi:hypothetical protein
MLLATSLLHIHNETNRSVTDKFKSAVDANPTATHRQHHHCPLHALHAPAAKFISLLASTSEQQSSWWVMWEPPTLIKAPAIHRVADFIC